MGPNTFPMKWSPYRTIAKDHQQIPWCAGPELLAVKKEIDLTNGE